MEVKGEVSWKTRFREGLGAQANYEMIRVDGDGAGDDEGRGPYGANRHGG